MIPAKLNSPIGMDRRSRVVAGAAGLVAIVLLTVTIAQSTIPDVTVHGAAKAINAWLLTPATGASARLALGASALSYLPIIIFLGGICRVVTEWARSPLWKSVALIASALFLAGAVCGDAMQISIPLLAGSGTDVHVSADIVAVTDRAWLVSYVEAHVALGTLALVVTIVGWNARRHGVRVPVVVLILGALGTLAVIPLVIFPTTFIVFLISNQLRLLWLVVTALWLIVRRSSLTAENID
jgi:hypothetical protein